MLVDTQYSLSYLKYLLFSITSDFTGSESSNFMSEVYQSSSSLLGQYELQFIIIFDYRCVYCYCLKCVCVWNNVLKRVRFLSVTLWALSKTNDILTKMSQYLMWINVNFLKFWIRFAVIICLKMSVSIRQNKLQNVFHNLNRSNLFLTWRFILYAYL